MNIINELLQGEKGGSLTKDVIDRFHHLSPTLTSKQVNFGRAIINRTPVWTPVAIVTDESLWVVVNQFGEVESNPLPKAMAETERDGFAADYPTHTYTIQEA